MADESFTNFRATESTITEETTVTFGFRARRITTINDSTTKNLSFKFNASETYDTLQPTETISLQLISGTVYLNGDSVPARVWGTG